MKHTFGEGKAHVEDVLKVIRHQPLRQFAVEENIRISCPGLRLASELRLGQARRAWPGDEGAAGVGLG